MQNYDSEMEKKLLLIYHSKGDGFDAFSLNLLPFEFIG